MESALRQDLLAMLATDSKLPLEITDCTFASFTDALRSASNASGTLGLHHLLQVISVLATTRNAPEDYIFGVIELIDDLALDLAVTGADILSLFQALRMTVPLEQSKLRGGVRFRQSSSEIAANKDKNSCQENSTQKTAPIAPLSVQIPNSSSSLPLIPIQYHQRLLKALAHRLRHDSPSHMNFFGDKDSFLSMPSVKLTCPAEYTVCSWLRIDESSPPKGFLLYRSRSTAGGIDAIVSDRQPNNSWTVTLRSYVGNGGIANAQIKGETQGLRITLIPNQWHLVSVRHVNAHTYASADYVTVSIDGQAIFVRPFEQGHKHSSPEATEDARAAVELVYPFRGGGVGEVLDTQWVYGLGFRGKVYNVSIYGEEMTLASLRNIYGLGPYTAHVARGVSAPQTTFDSGYLVLGSQYCKGPDARRACRLAPQLCVTADSFPDKHTPVVENCPQMSTGRISVDHIIMIPFVPEQTVTLSLNGKCSLSTGHSWTEACVCEGGVLLCLYLLWDYCGAVTMQEAAAVSSSSTSAAPESASARIGSVLDTLAGLVSASIEFKEHFIQLHGFHVVAQCLARQSDGQIRKAYVNVDLVDCVTSLVTSMGMDAFRGDGISSALQGLLLDFRIWGGEHALDARAHLLQTVLVLVRRADDILYRCVGTQRILDILRLYVFRSDKESYHKDVIHDNERDGWMEECANAGQHLLQNVLDAALIHAEDRALADARAQQRQPWQLPPAGKRELELLVSCLEETQSSSLAERLLLVMWELKARVPRTVLHVLSEERFADIVATNLLCKRGYSLLVRKRTLATLQWYIGEEMKKLPDEVVKLRVYENKVLGTDTFRPNLLAMTEQAKRQFLNTQEVDEDREQEEARISAIRKELLQPLLSTWEKLDMLAKNVDRAITDGAWGAIDKVQYEDLLAVLAHDGPLGTVKVWIQLPFLNTLLRAGRANPIQTQRLLMSANVMLKTERLQGELLCVLPPQLWINPFIALASLGKAAAVVATESGDKTGQEVAQTCVELSLDGLGTVFECAIRLYCEHSFVAWNVFLKLLRQPENIANELTYLKRITSLVMQRLSRSGDVWNADSISALVHILNIVESRRLCGNRLAQAAGTAAPAPSLLDDMETEEEAVTPIEQTQDERQILSFLVDIMASLRKAAGDRSLNGMEQYALRPAMRIIQSCFPVARAEMADRVCTEAMYQLQYMGEYWGAKNSDDYKTFFLRMIAAVKAALNDESLGEMERGRYQAHVYSIMHNFLDMRHSLATGGQLSPHTLSTLDLLIGVDSCNDITTIFQLIEVNFQEQGIINFVDDNYDAPAQPANAFESFPSSLAELLDMTEPIANPELPPPPPHDFLGDDTHHSGARQRTASSSNEQSLQKTQAWLSVRHGILADRIDSERARLSRSVQAFDVSVEAASKYWERTRMKLESEQFADQHHCEWKMGVAHEGSFPGRKRLVLRPRRLNKHNAGARARNAPISPSNAAGAVAGETSVTELGRAMKGYIRDATADNNGDAKEDAEKEADEEPGAGWGLVGEDGSPGGFGVVGTASSSATPKKGVEKVGAYTDPSLAPTTAGEELDVIVDVNGDIVEMETALTHGRMVETGPAHTGSRRFGASAALYEARVILITASGNVHGTLSFNSREIFFASTHDAVDAEETKTDAGTINLSKRPIRRRRWILSSLSALYLRRFRLRDSALEVFFRRGKHRNFFVDFGHNASDIRARDEFAKKLIKVVPVTPKNVPYLQRPTYGVPNSAIVRQHGVQEEWLAGKMSNFDYLMALNTIAGRTFNDTCQYPIMPWVIAQYTKATLDLSDLATFRDLSKPMGALNEERLADALERFDSMEEEYSGDNATSADIPPFMYGSHYSTMVGVVLHFLMRLQPFASLHCEMQGGHFDVADRLFSSVQRTWKQNTTQLSEVKEITPEWFTTPEMFQNINQFDLGRTQEGELVSDVILPPWAKNAEEFVRLNRQALESEYVSANLHHWIDLIFGFKQTGQAAVDANNVFFYLTYYNAVDRTRIDEEHRRQIELQIAHFGQTPMQLFTTPHPAKSAAKSKAASFLSSIDNTSPRPFRQSFPGAAAAAKQMQSPAHSFQKNAAGEYALSMAPATNIEEAASSNTKATSIPLPARLGASRIPALCVVILNTRIACLLSNGVIEVLKFGTSKPAKQALEAEKRAAVKRRRMSRGQPIEPLPGTLEASEHEADSIISFDDEYTAASLMNSNSTHSANSNTSSPRSPNQPNEAAFALPVPLVMLEPDRAHFDVLPRVFLPPGAASRDNIFKTTAAIRVTSSGNFLVTGGHANGSVTVRGLDKETGFLKNSGDYNGHKSRVVHLATDSIADADTDVVASVDDTGHLMVWTISGLSAPGTRIDKRNIISRRPQRMFRFPLCPTSMPCCDVVWQMGVVAVASGSALHVFSVERDEIIHALDISLTSAELKAHPFASQADQASTGTDLTADLLSFSSDMMAASGSTLNAATHVKHLALSDNGSMVMHLVYNDGHAMSTSKHFLAVHALSGTRLKLIPCMSDVTFLDIPAHGDVAISGHADGCVYLYEATSLQVLYACCPPLFSIPQNGSIDSEIVDGNSTVLSAKVGPDARFPAMLTVATQGGELYVKSLPDFIRWEKINSPSALSQVVNAPIKAVRTALQNASTLSSTIGENAGVLAHNVKGSMEDALGSVGNIGKAGLKSLGEEGTKMLSNFSSFFSRRGGGAGGG